MDKFEYKKPTETSVKKRITRSRYVSYHFFCKQCNSEMPDPEYRRVFCGNKCRVKYNSEQRLRATAEGSVREHSSLGCYQQKHKGKWVLQHRLVMESFLKRELTRSEKVRHINGNRKDNRIENLEVYTGVYRSKSTPQGVRVVDKILDMLTLLKPDELQRIADKIKELQSD